MIDRQAHGTRTAGTTAAASARRLKVASILLLIVDAGLVAWGAMAAAWLDQLIGPGGKPILAAGYEGFSKGSWSELVSAFPMAARYMSVLFRTYGMFNVAFGLTAGVVALTAFRRGERWAWWTLLAGNMIALVSAMTYDRVVHAIGPFELTEYLGLAFLVVAFAMTAPILRAQRPVRPAV
jgi:hypothetical protein